MVSGLMTRMVARQGRKLAKVVATTTVGMAALFYFFTSRKFAIVEREIPMMVRISHHSHTTLSILYKGIAYKGFSGPVLKVLANLWVFSTEAS